MAKKRKFPKRKRPCVIGKVAKAREKIRQVIPDKEERITYINALLKEFDESIAIGA